MYHTLNSEQKEVVFQEEGHLLVVAGPGSGKTHTITMRIAHLIDKGIEPEEIVAITFTTRAAREMIERLKRYGFYREKLFVGTIHALGKRIMEEEGIKVTLVNRTEALTLLRSLLTDQNVDKIFDNLCMHRNILRLSSDIKLQEIYYTYTEILKQKGLYDFEHLLEIPIALMNRPEGSALQRRVKEIIVDEFQDINPLQYEFIRVLSKKGARVLAVGDDDQAIYSFRGANAESLQAFIKDFSPSKVVLKDNYRNPPTILTVAEKVVKCNTKRIEKDIRSTKDSGCVVTYVSLIDESKEASYIADEIRKRLGGTGYHNLSYTSTRRSLSDIAILVRINALISPIKKALDRAGIPCRSIEQKALLEYESVKAILNYLSFILYHDEEALKRVMNIPKRGIGEKTLSSLIEKANSLKISLIEMIERNKNLSKNFKEFIQFIENIKINYSNNIFSMVKGIIELLGFMDYYKGERVAIEALMEVAYGVQSLDLEEGFRRIRDELVFLRGEDLYRAGSEAVYILTMHASKGLEFPVVFIAGLENGIVPLKMEGRETDEEEERRLLYVAMTRASEELILTSSRRRFLFGTCRHSEKTPLIEINGNIKEVNISEEKKVFQKSLF
jgi:DNA helicase-2/ATP-dependent DNA helicase PcrA